MAILENLTTKKKHKIRIGLIIGAVLLVIILISVAMGPDEKKRGKIKKTKSERGKFALLNDKIERESWIAAQGQNIKKLQVETNESKRSIESLKEQIGTLQNSLKDLKTKNSHRTITKKSGKPKDYELNSTLPPLPRIDGGKSNRDKKKYTQPKKLKELSQPQNTIKIYGNISDKSNEKELQEKKKEKEAAAKKSIILSSGSFMKGVLLNGVDAPTDFGAKGEPYPVLISITDSTTLPNLYRMNLKNCFIIGAVYGNLADERAYVRTEKLSCITASNRIIDVNLKGHVVGEDGKLGMRGRLVSKQGQLLAKSLLSGTFAGLGEAFKPEKSVSINLDPNGSVGYSSPKFDDFLKAGGAEGASNALNKIADFYLKMAEKIFPIIEIDAGREIEILVLNRTELKIGDAIEDSKGGES